MRSLRAIPDRLWAAGLAAAVLSLPALGLPSGQSGTAAGMTRILVPVGGLMVLAVVGGMGVMAVRRWLLAKDTAATDQGGLLDDLRRMRNTGQISAEEFDAAKQAIVSKLKAGLAGKAEGAGPRNPGRGVPGRRPATGPEAE